MAQVLDKHFNYQLTVKEIAEFLLSNAHFMIGGDDLIIQISHGFKKIFDLDEFKSFFQKAGFDITPATKVGELEFVNYEKDGDFLQYRVTSDESGYPYVVKKTNPFYKSGRWVQNNAPCISELTAASLNSTTENECAEYFYGVFQYYLQECGRISEEAYNEVLAKTSEPDIRRVLERREGFTGFPSYQDYKQMGYLVKPLPGLVNDGEFFRNAHVGNNYGSVENYV